MNFHLVKYELSCGLASQLPESTMPEVVFAGRSNVGKSSLINKVFNQKQLARVSATPGKTSTINFFRCADTARFADLPGYGYAKVSDSERRRWSGLIEGYFHQDRDIRLVLSLLDQAEYERLTGISANLNDGEIFAWYPSAVQKDSVTVDETEFTVKKWLDKNPLTCGEDAVSDNAVLVVTDEDFKKFDDMRTEMYKGVSSAPAGEDLTLHLGLDITGSETDKIDFGTPVMEDVKDLRKNGGLSENSWITSGIRQQEYESYYADNGSLLFIGIFLGSLFLMGTAMIIYYKQISEGYEDQKRFEIMQKVGLSRREVRSSVRRQILMVFFLPLLMAMLHITMAFPMIRRLLLLFGMTNTKLFIGCTAGTVLIFAVVYGLIYLMTARSYYHIVERK